MSGGYRMPDICYRGILQLFAYHLFVYSDKERAKKLYNEMSVEKLEKAINEKRNSCDHTKFIYEAGYVAGISFEVANNGDDINFFNDSLVALYMFEEFLGIK